MAVKIGSARIDENGRITGGKAGDQTGNEVGTQSWYKHSKGWRVLRPKSSAVAEAMAKAMQAACDNKHVGYNQNERNTLYAAAKKVGFDISKVKTDVNTDCSALVRVCCAYAGVLVGDFVTTSEASTLLKSGAFEELTDGKYTNQSTYLKRGDVLVTKAKGHTVIVLSDGEKAEKNEEPALDIRGTVEINNGTWYMRSAPNKNASAIRTVKSTDTVYYLGKEDSGWLYVRVNHQNGWVSAKAGSINKAAAYILIGNGKWYVRSASNKSANVLGTVSEGERLVYQGQQQNGWYLVIFEGQNGWVSGKAGVIV